ncbi:hypothetical protein GQX73_g5505 [Xylaria multiplex]|uniref:Uncharacterized protein n=1 Tax=Xylaria multiplex TaxID=323545 RepID=A0A7C8MLH8_9PEZI|nr:hypothetical protein GQX73_g5505 [Xylaria multiplex]
MQDAGSHYCQNQSDPPPRYTEYASERPRPHPTTLSGEQRLGLSHSHDGLASANDQAMYGQGSIQQIGESSQRLRKPVVIPATAASLGSPFLRAYPPSLEAFQISRGEFLDILDGLNRVAVRNPPLRALGLVGEVLEVVPLATAQTVGLAVNAAAQLGTFALSKGATEVYLSKMNKEIFAPRGLKMEIAKLEAMARINKLPILDAAGGIRSDVQLQPLADVQEIQTISTAQRWLQALEPFVEPLDLESLPPINTDTNLWGRLQTAASEHERASSQKRILKK